MNAENKIALALTNLGTGSIYLKDGKLYHDDLGELPSVEEIAAVVRSSPEIIGDMLIEDALDEGIPVVLDTKTVRRIASGAASVADVERLTEARAEASRKVFSAGQDAMTVARKNIPAWMKIKRSAPWENSSPGEQALEIVSSFATMGKRVVSCRESYERLAKIVHEHPSEVAYVIANELHVRDALLDIEDELLNRINARKSTPLDAYYLIEVLVEAIGNGFSE